MVSIALFSWPLLTTIMVLRAYWPVALIVGLLGGYLLLPEQGGIDLPLLPALEKATIPSLTLLFLAILMRPGVVNDQASARTVKPVHALKGWLPKTRLGLVLFLMVLAGFLLTALTNGEQLVHANGAIRPGLGLYDGFSLLVASTGVIVPILLGRKFLAHPDQHKLFLQVLVIAGLLYSALVLYEVRMSPMLNVRFYGFFPHEWLQHRRDGLWGWRPVVFLNHGIWLAIFLAMTMTAAFALFKADPKERRMLWAGLWLGLVLILSNSFGALIIGMMMVAVIFLFSQRLKVLFMASIALIVLSYPILRGVDAVPTESLVSMAERVDFNRARSLDFRVRNEEILLDHAARKPLFGWGRHGRNQVVDERGQETTSDGAWIVYIATYGWTGYIGRFGILTLAILAFAFRPKQYKLDPASVALCLVLVANLIDMIPNATATPLTWLIAGALLGRLELGREGETITEEKITATSRTLDKAVYGRKGGVATTRGQAPTLSRARTELTAPERTALPKTNTVDDAAPYSRHGVVHRRRTPPARES